MRVIAFILSGLVLLLTCVQVGLLITFSMQPHTFHDVTKPVAKMTPVQYLQRAHASPILSRLGLLLTKESKRTLSMVIENHEDARVHHNGLHGALMVQEWMVEGLISRFIAIYDIDDLPDRVGPVRSVREYFLDGVAPWSTLFFHAGGSPAALERLEESDILTNFDGLRAQYHDLYTRDDDIPMPHNLFMTRETAQTLAIEQQPQQITWPPYETGSAKEAPQVLNIEIDYYNPLHNVTYTYDNWSRRYVRSNGRIDEHAYPHNVLVLEIPIEDIGEFGRLEMNLASSGEAVLFRTGKIYKGTWHKKEGHGFEFIDEEGNPLVFARGQTWMTVVPTMKRLSWERQDLS